ncbi:MAG: hypothetical protein FWG68_06975 [Defluviitaleaceae bacterium]|nr:hypothetical protein [Defluviitaleaceae bacterium]
MIIYSMEHFAGLYQMLILRLTKHRNEKAVLIVSLGENTIREKAPFFAKLKKTGLFDDIILLKWVSIMSHEDSVGEIFAPFSSLEELQAKIVATYVPVIEEHNLNLAESATIYALKDMTSDFTGFLSHLNIQYVWVESIPNDIDRLHTQFIRKRKAISPQTRLVHQELSINKEKRPLRKMVLFSETIYSPETPLSEPEQKLITVFDFTNKFNEIAEEDRLKFLSCFDFDMEFLQNNDLVILLPSSVLYTRNHSRIRTRTFFSDILYDDVKYTAFFAMFIDYFANKNYTVVYHPHPNMVEGIIKTDIIAERGAKCIDTNMPAEYLSWIPNVKFKQALSQHTTVTSKLAHAIEENIALGIEFMYAFNIMDRLYIIQKIISNLPHISIKFYGIPDKTMQTLYRCNFDDYPNKTFEMLKTVDPPRLAVEELPDESEIPEESKTLANTTLHEDDICIINTTLPYDEPVVQKQLILDMLETADENAVIFFTNIFYEYSFARVQVKYRVLLDFIVPIIIHRTKLDDGEPVGELGTITIYAFCKNEETRNQLKATNITKNLHYLNTILTVTPLSDEDAQAEYQKCWEHSIKNAIQEHLVNLRHQDSEKALKENLAQEKQAMQQEMATMQQQLYQANYQLQQEKTAHQATKAELETASQKKGFFGKFGK